MKRPRQRKLAIKPCITGTNCGPTNYELYGAEHTGAYEARGIFGQRIYVNPKEKLVILTLSARPKPDGPVRDTVNDYDFYKAVIEALR